MMNGYIYSITNKETGRVYIGQTANITKRWESHLSSLINGTHVNKELQSDFYSYGLTCFSFEVKDVIELNPEFVGSELLREEERWIALMDCYQPKGYNYFNEGAAVRFDGFMFMDMRKDNEFTFHCTNDLIAKERVRMSEINAAIKKKSYYHKHKLIIPSETYLALEESEINSLVLKARNYSKVTS